MAILPKVGEQRNESNGAGWTDGRVGGGKCRLDGFLG